MILAFVAACSDNPKVRGDDSLSHDTLENVRWLGTGWLLEYEAGRDLDANAEEGSRGRAGQYILGQTLRSVSWRGATFGPWEKP